MVKITDVKIRISQPESQHIALASITIDDEIIINDIKLYRSNNKFSCVLPCDPQTASHGKKNILINNQSTYNAIKDKIVEQYIKQVNN
ncbi:MAG: septation protein SpoVG family protein [Ruminococcus sp.]